MKNFLKKKIFRLTFFLLILCFVNSHSFADKIIDVRVWPAKDFTRIILEKDLKTNFEYFLLKNPDRFILDVKGLKLDSKLRSLVKKIKKNDPYIQNLRIGQNRPNVVRLVFDLKKEVRPQVFNLNPVGKYKHRLIFDLYPTNNTDLISIFLQEKYPYLISKNRLEEEKSNNLGNKNKKIFKIVIDPGHGGEDPGAIGRKGNLEKTIVLSIAKKLKKKLEGNNNIKVILTREGDYFIPLKMRVQKARKFKADLFISLHADAFIKSSAKGSSVFILSEKGASSSAARWLAKKENSSDLIGGINIKNTEQNLASVLLDLSTTAQINDSLKIAKLVLNQISYVNTLHKNKVEQAGFEVLKAPDIPSILIETAFISNPSEEKKLITSNYQDKIAEAIKLGVINYLKK